LYNKETLLRLSVVSFKQQETTVHIKKVYEILSSAFRYCNVTDDPGSNQEQKYARRRDRQIYMSEEE